MILYLLFLKSKILYLYTYKFNKGHFIINHFKSMEHHFADDENATLYAFTKEHRKSDYY